jgi:hypothetical protein
VPEVPEEAAASLVPILPLASTTRTVSSAMAGRSVSCKFEPVILFVILTEPDKDKLLEIVAPFVTRREFRTASEPDVMTFFQFGIIPFKLWLATQKLLCPLPLEGL